MTLLGLLRLFLFSLWGCWYSSGSLRSNDPGNMHNLYLSSSLVFNQSFESEAYSPEEFRKLSFFSRDFYVKSPVKGTSDIIQWVEGGHDGEGKVSLAFERELRLGNGTDAHERGLCSLYHKNHHQHRPIVLDVGANAGIYGLYGASLGCAVYFFDIQEVCHRWISAAIRKNNYEKHAFLIPRAVGNETRTISIGKKSNSCHGVYSLSKTGTEYFVNSMKSREDGTADEVRLDDIFREVMVRGKLPTLAMIKIDTEGFEPYVLAGMKKLLLYADPLSGKGAVRNLIIELAPERWRGLEKPLSRSDVANVVCENLWDAGFTQVTAFSNNFVCCDKHFESRKDLHDYITFGTFPDNRCVVLLALFVLFSSFFRSHNSFISYTLRTAKIFISSEWILPKMCNAFIHG